MTEDAEKPTCCHCGSEITHLPVIGWTHVAYPSWLYCEKAQPHD